MALSGRELNQISSRKLATNNKRYYGDNEKIYIGTPDGRLRLLDKASVSPFTPVENILANNIQEAIEDVNSRLIERSKEIEIDFGLDLYQTQKIFNIIDINILETNKIIANLMYKAPTNKDLDELEMDELTLKCKANNGSVDILVTSLLGSVYGCYIINYQINY